MPWLRSALPAALLALALCAGARADTGRGDAALGSSLSRRFGAAEDRWLLSALLSDAGTREAFLREGAAAAEGGPQALSDFDLRWRKRLVALAGTYRSLLQRDIVRGAPSVEQMIPPSERRLTEQWLRHQTAGVQAEFREQVAKGNSWLGMARGTVEDRIADARRQMLARMDAYVSLPASRQAAAYSDSPAKTPSRAPALEQVKAAAEAAASAGRLPLERAAQTAGADFAGNMPSGGPVPAGRMRPTRVSAPAGDPGRAGGQASEPTGPALRAPASGARAGGFHTQAPPSPAKAAKEGSGPKAAAAGRAAPADPIGAFFQGIASLIGSFFHGLASLFGATA